MAIALWLLVGGPLDGQVIARTHGDFSPHSVVRLERANEKASAVVVPTKRDSGVVTYSARVVEQFPGGPRYRVLAAPGIEPMDCEEPIRRANFEPFSGGFGDGQP